MAPKTKKAKASASRSPQTSTAECSGVSIKCLPEELLQKILCSFPLGLERWFQLALVCRQWKDTMQKLVPADFSISQKSHLQRLEHSSVKVGSITVTRTYFRPPSHNLAPALQRLLTCSKLDTTYLTSLAIQPNNFFKKSHRLTEWLPELNQLRRLDVSVHQDVVAGLLEAAPERLEDLQLCIDGDYGCEPKLAGLSRLRHLQNLKLRVMHELKPTKDTLAAHKERLFSILAASKSLLGLPEMFHGQPASCTGQMKRKPNKDKAVVSDAEGGSSRAAERTCEAFPAFCSSPRPARVAQLTAIASADADLARRVGRGNGPAAADALHAVLQALQWHLALALVLDSDEAKCGSLAERLRELWEAADIGPFWIDLRPLKSLLSCHIDGLHSIWFPSSLQQLNLDTCGYTGPLPAGLTKYVAKLRASSSVTHWELRPFGFLPLTELEAVVSCSEERRSREFCFRVLQGTHSLNLHSKLQRLCLVSDRGLHVDAEISHHLLNFLARRRHLRSVVIGSAFLRLQGDPIVGRGVAALNLLSDLKDHCGWDVQHSSSSLPVLRRIGVTTCRPPLPEDWTFAFQDEDPDFVSDFL